MGRIVLPVYTPYYIPNGNEVAVIETSRGTIRVQLAGKDAPVTAGNFIELAARGFYDKLKFHAHKPGSVVLGGCPTTRTLGPAQVDAAARGMIRGIHPGTGDARYTIVDEWETNPNNKHVLGSLCMAHKSEPNSVAASSTSRCPSSRNSTISSPCSGRPSKGWTWSSS